MLCAVVRLLHIKDLKDLNNITRHRLYRHAGPKGPEEIAFSLLSPRRLSAAPAPPCNQSL